MRAKLVKGARLTSAQKRAVLAAFVHRFTGEHRPAWSLQKMPNGGSYAPTHATDTEWVNDHAFYITAQGALASKPGRAEPVYLADERKNPIRGSARKNPIKGPGKFEGELHVTRFAHDNPDEEIGSVDELGWFGYLSGKIKGRGPFHIITQEDSQGFVYGQMYDSKEKLLKKWRSIEKEYERYYEQNGEG